MRYLVTGAGGFLGSYLTKLLVAQGDVLALVKPTTNLWRLSDVPVEFVYEAPKNIDVVFHLAWQDDTVSNLMSSLELFPCPCFIGIGSQAEFGPTAYGTSKACVRLLTSKLAELCGGKNIWLRFLTVYGPKDNPEHLIPTVIRELLARRRPALTWGNEEWDYLYVEDAAEAIFEAVTYPGGIYNMGSGKIYTVRNVVERIRDLIDSSLPLGFGEYKSEKQMYLRADTIVGHTSIDEGLRRTIDESR